MTSDSGAERKFWQIALADLERQLQQLRGNQCFRHFHMSTISTPYGGPPPLNVVGQPRP
jgi:hypothetical protein